jgi:cytoskeleton protein RodZ
MSNHVTQGLESATEVLDDADNLGIQFSRARRAKKIELEQAAKETKIKPSFIKAIERGDFDLLPGGIYTKGYVRTYSDYLGLPTQNILAELERLETGGITDSMMPYAPQRSARINMKPANWLMLLCFIGISGIVLLWNDRAKVKEEVPTPIGSDESAAPQPVIQPPMEAAPATPTSIPTQAIQPVPSAPPASAPVPVITVKPAPPSNEPDPLANIQKQLQEASDATKKAIENIDAKPANVPATNDSENSVNQKPLDIVIKNKPDEDVPAKPQEEEKKKEEKKVKKFVTLIAKRPTTITLYNKDGKKIFDQEIGAGESFALPQRDDIRVKTSDSKAVDMMVDDENAGNLGAISSDGGVSVGKIHESIGE